MISGKGEGQCAPHSHHATSARGFLSLRQLVAARRKSADERQTSRNVEVCRGLLDLTKRTQFQKRTQTKPTKTAFPSSQHGFCSTRSMRYYETNPPRRKNGRAAAQISNFAQEIAISRLMRRGSRGAKGGQLEAKPPQLLGRPVLRRTSFYVRATRALNIAATFKCGRGSGYASSSASVNQRRGAIA